MPINDTPYATIKTQNKSLKKYISSVNDYRSLERNQFARKNDNLPYLENMKKMVLILYGIVYLVLLLVLFIKGYGLSIYIKIILVLLFGLYPIFIYPIENELYKVYYYVYSVILGESYHTIMIQKDLQNPKNVKDIKNLGYAT